jgi:uncharacterized membrane protein YdbT with pleckstrin-like domain
VVGQCREEEKEEAEKKKKKKKEEEEEEEEEEKEEEKLQEGKEKTRLNPGIHSFIRSLIVSAPLFLILHSCQTLSL